MTTAQILQLQPLIGNQAVGRILKRNAQQRGIDTGRKNLSPSFIQRKIVTLSDGRIALDEEEESLVNDGTETYEQVAKNGTWYQLRDNWGNLHLYDDNVHMRYAVILRDNNTYFVLSRDGEHAVYNQANHEVISGAGIFMKIAKLYLFGTPPANIRDFFESIVRNEPELLRTGSSYFQKYAPDLIPHSRKAFQKSGTLHLNQGQIVLGGTQNDYSFIQDKSAVRLYFKGIELGHITLKIPAKKHMIEVDDLKVHDRFQNMNLSRILMVMLARVTITQGNGKYRLGTQSPVTNPAFWNQYDNDGNTLLARGDHQIIDVPNDPVVESQ
jgi:hypothetical protein